MKGRTRWIAALVAVIGLAVMIVYEPPEEEQTSSSDRPSGPSAPAGDAQAQEIEATRDAVLDTLEQQQAAQETLGQPPTLPGSQDARALQDLELPIPPIPEFAETVRDFASQADDALWSGATESRIFGEISQATGLGVSDIQVDCRTTLCRVQLSNPESTLDARYRSFNELVDTFGLETLWLWAAPDRDGNPINLVYLQRGGASATRSEAQ